MLKRVLLLVGLLFFVAAPSAFAQVASKEVFAHFGFGWIEPQGKAGDAVNPGWGFSGGAEYHMNPKKPFNIRFDFGYNWFYANKQTIEEASATTKVDDGFASMTTLTADAVWNFAGHGHAGGYFGIGLGGYSRYYQLTQTVVASGIYCDPWTGWCYPVTTVGSVIANSDRLTKLGYNAIVGITFPLQSGSEMYLEVAYHWMDTSPTTDYVPIILGWRW